MADLNPINIKGTSISDAWFQLIYKIVEEGRTFKIDRGSFAGDSRCEFDYATIHITHPATEPLLPKLSPLLGLDDPVAPDYLERYLPYLMSGEEQPGESYTYGQRMCKEDVQEIVWNMDRDIHIEEAFKSILYDTYCITEEDDVNFLNQMELMIWTYKNKGHRNNQMCLQVGNPSDMLLKDPPCLRHIDTRIQDNKLHFFPYFRSWDLYGGFPANIAAIEMMKQYCAGQIGVENGEIIASSKGLHIYKYVFEIAEIIRGRSMEEFRKEMTGE